MADKAPAKRAESQQVKPAQKPVLVVTAPLVQVSMGGRMIHLHDGDVVPAGVDPESLEHLSDLGYLAESQQ